VILSKKRPFGNKNEENALTKAAALAAIVENFSELFFCLV
jgi:hypothetical protein